MLAAAATEGSTPMDHEQTTGEERKERSVHASDVDGEFPHLLAVYYQRLFPYSKFVRWLSYGGADKRTLANREFSFTLKDDVYVRFQSFSDQQQLMAAIQKKNPYKIDIGAVYSAKPSDHKKIKASEFYPVERELVFDIDMTDYDEIRTCCSGAAICHKCWPFMTAALRVIDSALREDFGFRHLLWVYSGRRGIHCWVCDKRARQLSQDARSAVAEYLQLIKGGDHVARKVNVMLPPHPMIERSLNICTEYFHKTVLSGDSQDLLATAERQKQVLSIVGDERIQSELLGHWQGDGSTSEQKWRELVATMDKEKKNKTLTSRKHEIVLQYVYPRLDIHVSKGMNHLLKSPFVVHPKTGRVCVPIDPERPEEFDPFKVPTIQDLCAQIDDYDDVHGSEDSQKKIKDYQKTDLAKYMAIFERFLKGLEEENRVVKQDAMDQSSDW